MNWYGMCILVRYTFGGKLVKIERKPKNDLYIFKRLKRFRKRGDIPRLLYPLFYAVLFLD